MNEIKVWGIKINPLTKDQIIRMIDEHISGSGDLFHLTGVNPETIAKSSIDGELRTAINHSDLVNIDNMLVVTSLRILGYKVPERVACPDVFEELLSVGNTRGYSAYFFGAQQEILEQMCAKISTKYPGLIIAGKRNGFFKKEEEISIVQEIKRINPDMLFIGLPTPQKEMFIHNNKNILGARFAFGVGGAFDVLAGKVVRAPKWMRSVGLEGFHRIAQSPANYGARAVKFYVPFFRLLFNEMFKKEHKGRR